MPEVPTTPEAATILDAPTRRYSGKTLIRMPESLHAELARIAGEHGISMNRLIVYLLAWGTGRAAMPPERHLRLARALEDWKRRREWIWVDR
jgi:hypothetical protein